MTTMLRLLPRSIVRRAVRGRIRFTIRTYHSITLIRQQYPVLPMDLDDDWREFLARTRPILISGVSDWLLGWFQPTPIPATPPGVSGSPGGPGGRRRHNAKQLLPSDIRRMRINSSDYVCHRTDDSGVGRCEASLRAETDQAKKKNPMAPHGIYATIGVRGLQDYGRFGIVYPRYGRRVWTVKDAPAVLCAVDELGIEDAEGWFTQEDYEEAQR